MCICVYVHVCVHVCVHTCVHVQISIGRNSETQGDKHIHEKIVEFYKVTNRQMGEQRRDKQTETKI